jgi:hypothetical protein
MFPITYRHQFDYTVQGDERWIAGMLRQHFATILQKKGAEQVTIEGQRVLFDGRFSDPMYWGFLFRSVSKGEVTVVCRNNRLSIALDLSFAGLIIWWFIIFSFLLGVYVLVAVNFSTILCILGVYGLMCAGFVLLKCLQFFVFMQSQIMWFFDSAADSGVQATPIASR